MLTRSQQDLMRANVQRGATVLDEKYPTWFRKIDLDNLDLGSCEECVCGQLAYSYFTKEACESGDPFAVFGKKLMSRLSFARRAIVSHYWGEATTEFGFDIPDNLDSSAEGYAFLDRQWTRQINRRRAAEAV
jgi:hypothetical protein